MAFRRDIHQGPWSLNVSVPHHRQRRRHSRVLLQRKRDLLAAKRFIRKALQRHGRPERIVIDGSQTNQETLIVCDNESRLLDRSRHFLKPIRIRWSQYLNNRIEQDHRRIKGRVAPMLGFKSPTCAETILSGIEMVHMMRKGQARYAYNPAPSLAEQFNILAA